RRRRRRWRDLRGLVRSRLGRRFLGLLHLARWRWLGRRRRLGALQRVFAFGARFFGRGIERLGLARKRDRVRDFRGFGPLRLLGHVGRRRGGRGARRLHGRRLRYGSGRGPVGGRLGTRQRG